MPQLYATGGAGGAGKFGPLMSRKRPLMGMKDWPDRPHKRRIVREAEVCQVPGEVGALLRREGLYTSHLTHWRKEVEASEQAALALKRRGPTWISPRPSRAGSRRWSATPSICLAFVAIPLL
jgi:hypothetical protein